MKKYKVELSVEGQYFYDVEVDTPKQAKEAGIDLFLEADDNLDSICSTVV